MCDKILIIVFRVDRMRLETRDAHDADRHAHTATERTDCATADADGADSEHGPRRGQYCAGTVTESGAPDRTQ